MPYVRGHYRDGHYVRPHWRRAVAGGGGALGVLGLLAVLFLGLTNAGPGTPHSSDPQQARLDGYVVQLASHRDVVTASEQAAALRGNAHNASVLRSDDYGQMRAGWFVVVLGPFGTEARARASVEPLRASFKDAFVRRLS